MKNQVLHIMLPTDSTEFKIIELANWIGKVFVVPRVHLKDLKERKEINDPAIYFLFGENDDLGKQKLYIGETEIFFNRLTNHDLTKDFWNVAIIFTGGLDKAKVKYLEYLSNKEALAVGRFDLQNNTVPKENNLSEFDELSTKDYFEKIAYILSVFGYPVFESIEESLSDSTVYYLKAEGADAKAQLLNDGSLNVLKDSIARIRESKSFWGWSLNARKKFIEEEILVEVGDGLSYRFTQDTLFKSPSAAAATITGRPINGWTAWKDVKGLTLDENIRKL